MGSDGLACHRLVSVTAGLWGMNSTVGNVGGAKLFVPSGQKPGKKTQGRVFKGIHNDLLPPHRLHLLANNPLNYESIYRINLLLWSKSS